MQYFEKSYKLSSEFISEVSTGDHLKNHMIRFESVTLDHSIEKCQSPAQLHAQKCVQLKLKL